MPVHSKSQTETRALLAPSSTTTADRQGSISSTEKKSSKEKESYEATDEVSIQGPKKSDGSEFRKGFKGWSMSVFYLSTVWFFGAAFSVLIMYLLLIQLNERPHFFGRGTHIGGVPHILFEPNPNRFDVSTRSVVTFRATEPASYENLMIRYKSILKDEYNMTIGPKCSRIRGVLDGAPTNKSVCQVEADSKHEFGECTLTLDNINRGMGFSRTEPCIMLRLTRIIGWYPNDFKDSNERSCEAGPHSYSPHSNCCNRRRITFSCTSSSVNIKMLPSDGISTCAYPFWNKAGYQQPFVMLKLSNLTDGKNEIRCSPALESIKKLDDGTENTVRITLESLPV
ncbi:hypothetical protein RB195_000540 [Necator americanus]|uniref:Sodium / potassium ATPase beta chain n=1 Tax=Necator americanus TaxID=51031 RepID=A0ABR1DBI4_NECAM